MVNIKSSFESIQQVITSTDTDTLKLAANIACACKITAVASVLFASSATLFNFISAFKRPIFGGIMLATSIAAIVVWHDLARTAENFQNLCGQDLKVRKISVSTIQHFANQMLKNTAMIQPIFGSFLQKKLAQL